MLYRDGGICHKGNHISWGKTIPDWGDDVEHPTSVNPTNLRILSSVVAEFGELSVLLKQYGPIKPVAFFETVGWVIT